MRKKLRLKPSNYSLWIECIPFRKVTCPPFWQFGMKIRRCPLIVLDAWTHCKNSFSYPKTQLNDPFAGRGFRFTRFLWVVLSCLVLSWKVPLGVNILWYYAFHWQASNVSDGCNVHSYNLFARNIKCEIASERVFIILSIWRWYWQARICRVPSRTKVFVPERTGTHRNQRQSERYNKGKVLQATELASELALHVPFGRLGTKL